MTPRKLFFALVVTAAVASAITDALAHAVTPGDKGYIQELFGVHIEPVLYLGAKHMVTGFDHILFLFAVIFFLYRMKDVAVYVSLFALGHSATMIAGVLLDFGMNAYIIDAIIGFSIVYKALDNLGAYRRWFGFQPSTRAATLIFGLFHGFGLASKLIDYEISEEGLLANLIAFNVGVEIGQLLALGVLLVCLGWWRRSGRFARDAFAANVVIMTAGFVFVGLQMTGYFVS
jgi:hypothetical protein